MSFDFFDLSLEPRLVQALIDLGYETPTPIQSAVIPVMLTGQDVIGQAQTGTGKTAAFALPMLQNLSENSQSIQGLVLAPTRELALQVSQAVSAYCKHINMRVLAVYGGAPYGPQITQLKRGVDIVVGTPGRMMDLIDRGVLDLSEVKTVVLDEADEMLSMGFVEDIQSILSKTPDTRQTALFSATMPQEIRRLADRYMKDPQSIVIQGKQTTGDGIEQRYYLVHKSDKLSALTRLFETEDVSSALIFVRTRVDTGVLANELTNRGFPAEALNGDLNQDSRERTLLRFRNHQVKVLVATDVAARGLDIDDISHVFNYDLPEDPEIYVHRIGRTGRAGKTGIAISLLSPSEKRKLGQIESFARRKITFAVIPTEEDILALRDQNMLKQLQMWLKRGRYKKEREVIEGLVADGLDPIEIAAAAMKMARAEEKQRPIAPVAVLSETRERPVHQEQRFQRRETMQRSLSGGKRTTNEAGMVRLNLNAGKQQGIRPNDIVGAIAFHADIPGYTIGKIVIQDQSTMVDIPEEYVQRVLGKSKEIQIRKQPIVVQMA